MEDRVLCWNVFVVWGVLYWLSVSTLDASARAKSIKTNGERTFSSIGGVKDGRPVVRITSVYFLEAMIEGGEFFTNQKTNFETGFLLERLREVGKISVYAV